jgi:hypothetical protein
VVNFSGGDGFPAITISPLVKEGRSPGNPPSGLLLWATAHATGNEKPTENCCSDLLNDECSNFRRGNNYGVECVRTQRQRLHLDSCRSRSEPYSSRAYSVADRTPSASSLRPVAHTIARKAHVPRNLPPEIYRAATCFSG